MGYKIYKHLITTNYRGIVEKIKLAQKNKPISSLMTHSYGFHTANGRGIIERIKSYYYEYKSNN